MNNVSWFTCIPEYERLVSEEFHNNIRDTKYRVDPRVGSYFHSLDFFKWYNYKIGSKKFPSEINESFSSKNPYVRIPIKYLIDKNPIDSE